MDEKSRTDARRLENSTGRYTLVDLETRYQWCQLGVYLAGWLDTDRSGRLQAVPG